MWIWRDEYVQLQATLRQAEIKAAKLEGVTQILLEQAALTKQLLEKAEARNQSLFDVIMQLKHQHPGTGYQDAMKSMFVDGEMLQEEDPEELARYHTRMQQLKDAGMDPGMILLEDMDELRDESGDSPAVPEGA